MNYKILFILSILIFFNNNTVFSECLTNKNTVINEYYYPILLNVLNIPIEQKSNKIKELNIIRTQTNKQLESKGKDNYKLSVLKTAHCSLKEIIQQKKEIKKIKEDLKDLDKKEQNIILKDLTSWQKYKYKRIKKLIEYDIKTDIDINNYYKKNPRLPIFGSLK